MISILSPKLGDPQDGFYHQKNLGTMGIFSNYDMIHEAQN